MTKDIWSTNPGQETIAGQEELRILCNDLKHIYPTIHNLIVDFNNCMNYNIGLYSTKYENFLSDNCPIYFINDGLLQNTDSNHYLLCADHQLTVDIKGKLTVDYHFYEEKDTNYTNDKLSRYTATVRMFLHEINDFEVEFYRALNRSMENENREYSNWLFVENIGYGYANTPTLTINHYNHTPLSGELYNPYKLYDYEYYIKYIQKDNENNIER